MNTIIIRTNWLFILYRSCVLFINSYNILQILRTALQEWFSTASYIFNKCLDRLFLDLI